MLEIKTDSPGRVYVTDEVIAVIAGTAALEVEEVAGLSGNIADEITGKLGRRSLLKGVAVENEEGAVRVSVEVIIKPGSKLQDVSRDVQSKVKAAIETMTGLSVVEANVSINPAAEAKARA